MRGEKVDEFRPIFPVKFEEVVQIRRIEGQQGEFTFKLVSLCDIPAGEVVADLSDVVSLVDTKRYTTVQVGRDAHVELNCEFVYMNHSCSPSVRVEVGGGEEGNNITFRVVAERKIKRGDELTFFYPSTEWEMAQPFECWCSSEGCVRIVRGAKYISEEERKRCGVSEHIREMGEFRPIFPVLYSDHVQILRMEGEEGDYTSKLVTRVPYREGDVIADLSKVATLTKEKRYTTVQIGIDTHVELNCEFVYMNHSCSPSVFVDTSLLTIVALRELTPSDELTFFYPSTEWDMSQPFNCWCQSRSCICFVQGAKSLPSSQLAGFRLSEHIAALVAEREAHGAEERGAERERDASVVETEA